MNLPEEVVVDTSTLNNPPVFKVGDIVQLKCGSCKMVVLSVNWLEAKHSKDGKDRYLYECSWQAHGVPYAKHYPEFSLLSIEDNSPYR